MAMDAHLRNFLRETVNYLNDNFETIQKDIHRKFVLTSDGLSIEISKNGEFEKIFISKGQSSASFYSNDLNSLEESLLNKIKSLVDKIGNA